MMITKKSVEGLILLVLALGLLLASSLKNSGMFYIIIFIAGIITGRVAYLQQPPTSKKLKLPLFFIICLFLVSGLTFASPFSKPLALLLFLAGTAVSIYLHYKKIMGNFKSKPFVTM